jgi:hypothetical protein
MKQFFAGRSIASTVRLLTQDRVWSVFLQALLLVLVCIALSKAVWRWFHPGIDLIVPRGDRSLNWLYFSYVATTFVYTLAVQVSDWMKGRKVFVILLDYILITYLFMADPWFRNWAVFPLFQLASQD